MNPIKRSLRAFARLLASYALLTFMTVLPIDGVFMLQRMSSVFAFVLAVSITLYFSARTIEPRVRKYLIVIGVMIIFWCILRAAKYIAFEESETIARFIWYLYYIPMLMIPQISFQASLSVGEPEDKKLPLIQNITGAVSVLCILFVLTNDLHQLVFRFNPGFANWDAEYSHEPLYWIITVWNYMFFFFSVSVLFRKCRLSASRRLIWIPTVYVSLGVLALYLLVTGNLLKVWGNNIGGFPEIACFMLGGFWILCITIGLIPSNKGYEKLLQETSLAARIANLDYEVAYQSRSAVPMTKEQLASSVPVKLDENTLVHRRPVTGGYAYWQVDITELNAINRELEDTQEMLAEETELLRKENELREKQAQIDEKSKVYDAIAVRVLPQSQKIAALSAQAQGNAERFDHNMRLVSIYAAYIKRMSNMMLLAPEGRIKVKELSLALGESARYLNKAGFFAKISSEADDATLPAEKIISLYERFENLLEQALPTLHTLQITLSQTALKLSFEGAELTLPEDFDGTAETDDDITFVRLPIREDGEKA